MKDTPVRISMLSLGLSLLSVDRALMARHSCLLVAHVTNLRTTDVLVLDARLPRRDALEEHLFNIFKGLAGRLGETEEGVDGHGSAEDTEDDIDFPLDVDEGRRDEVAALNVKCVLSQRNGPSTYERAKLKIQLAEVVKATALPRTRRGNSSGG